MQYFIIVASKDHIQKGYEGGFAQAGHGKKTQLNKMQKGDGVIFYASKESYPDGRAYRKFTAIGKVTDEKPYQVEMNPGFEPWRRNIQFYPAIETEIKPLLDDLSFISNKKHWGLHLMSGFVEIGKADFDLIAGKMLRDKTESY
ncbi:MAG: EVE domain-containing protein [Bacteroidales bacterium]|nr:EVE domain-containing protein [Bacteroidales bacterium]